VTKKIKKNLKKSEKKSQDGVPLTALTIFFLLKKV